MPENKKSIAEFSAELSAARNSRGLSLEQINDYTKISLRYLRAMEEGEWELLPEPYMEAFLKAYAEAVGMSVPKVMKQYRETVHRKLRGEEEPEPGVESGTPATNAAITAQKRSRRWIIYAFAGGAVLAVAGILFVLYLSPKKVVDVSIPVEYERISSKSDTARRQVFADTLRRADSAITHGDTLGALRVVPDSLLAAPQEVPTGLRLTGRAHQPCWIRATLDRRKIQDVLLGAGDTIAWRAATEIEMIVGNAGGLELVLDGESLGVLGPPGKVVTVLVTPEGIKSQKMGSSHLPPDSLLNVRKASNKVSVDTSQTDSTR